MTALQSPGSYLVDLNELIQVLAVSVPDAVELAKLYRGDPDNSPRSVVNIWRRVEDKWELVQ